MSDDTVRKDAPLRLFFLLTFLVKIGQKYLCLFLRNQTFPPAVVYICSLHLLHFKSVDKHSFSLHFYITTVILVNFTFSVFEEKRMTLWLSIVKYLISNLFVNSFISHLVHWQKMHLLDTLIHFYPLLWYLVIEKKKIYMKHISGVGFSYCWLNLEE